MIISMGIVMLSSFAAVYAKKIFEKDVRQKEKREFF